MSIDPSTSGTLDFKQASKVTFVGSSSNTVIDTVTGSFGIGVDVNGPSSNLHVVGHTRLEGDINMLHTSNNAAIKLNSNVVTEFPRSKKLIKYPRVALTQNDESATSGYVASASSALTANPTYWVFDEVATTFWHSQYPYFNTSNGLYSPGQTAAGTGTPSANSTLPTTELVSGHQGEWISIELPSKIKLDRLKVIGSTRLSSGINQFPKDVVVAVSETGLSGSWSVLQTASLISQNVSNHSDTINITTQTSYYKYFALIVKSINSTATYSAVEIAGLELYGLPEYDPDAAGVDVKVTSYPNVPNTDWLEVYYDAKESSSYPGTGGTVVDLSGNSRNAEMNATFDNGEIKAFDFSGAYTSNVTTSDHGLGTGDVTYTMSYWFKRTAKSNGANNDYIIMMGNGGTARSSILMHIINDELHLDHWAASIKYKEKIVLNKWYHVVAGHKGGVTPNVQNDFIYIDGKLSSIFGGGTVGNFTLAGSKLTLGSEHNGTTEYFNGKIANFRLFNRALTSDEVWQLYAYQKEYFGHGDLSMTLKAGRLGIGTSEPRAALDVRGDIYSRDIYGGCPVYFLVHFTSDVSGNTTYIDFDNITHNKGGGWGDDTTKFYAPKTGYYHFSISLMGTYINGRGTVIEWMKNGNRYVSGTYSTIYDYFSGGHNEHMHVSGSMIMYLEVGDWMGIKNGASPLSAGYNQFTGFYLSN